MRRRLKEHGGKLFVIKDTPHSIATQALVKISSRLKTLGF
jgi:ribosomal protein L10